MRELYAADWYAMRKNHLLYWLIACAAVLAVVGGIARVAESNISALDIDDGPLVITAMLVGAAAGILCGDASEQQYRDGLIRNQIVTGHTRGQVFWAHYLSTATGTLLIAGAYAGPLTLLESAAGAEWPENPNQVLTGICVTVGIVLAYDAIYLLLGTIMGRKKAGIACMVAFCVLFVTSFAIYDALNQPEYDQVVEYTAFIDGAEVDMSEIPTTQVANPHYVRGPLRGVYTFLDAFLPSGQALTFLTGSDSPRLLLYSLGFCAVCWGSGLLILHRKNIY